MCSEVHLGAFTYRSFTFAEPPVFLSGFRRSGKCTCPEKMDTKKRLDWLTYLELFDKQNVSSFSCW
jgi:hypothetical protein